MLVDKLEFSTKRGEKNHSCIVNTASRMDVSSLNCHKHWFAAVKIASLYVLCHITFFLAGENCNKQLKTASNQVWKWQIWSRIGHTFYVTHYGVCNFCYLDLCQPCKLDKVNLPVFTLHYIPVTRTDIFLNCS